MTKYRRTLIFLLFSSTLISASEERLPVKLTTADRYSRIYIPMPSDTPYELDVNKKRARVRFKNRDLADLGAPIGREQEWLKKLKNAADLRVKQVTLGEQGNDVVLTILFRYPEGKKALHNPKVKYFEFWKKSNHDNWVFDFWIKGSVTKAQAKKKILLERKIAALKSAETSAQQRENRRRALEKSRKRALNIERFCHRPLDDTRDKLIRFIPLHKEVNFYRWLPRTEPDENYPYLMPDGEGKESKNVALAIRLYREKKYGLTMRAIEFYEENFPKGEFANQTLFLKANLFLKLKKEKLARSVFEKIKRKASEDPVALHAVLFLAGIRIRDKNYLKAIEDFMWLLRNHPNHNLGWVFHLGLAESLFKLNQTDRARKEYLKVALKGPSSIDRARGLLRLGDVHMSRRRYAQAVAAYFKAAREYPQEAREYPQLFLNKAEALFWLGEYAQSEEEFLGFLENFKGHPSGWRATLRLAEIYGRNSNEFNSLFRKNLRKTIEEYPFSSGAFIARAKLSPCEGYGGMDFEALNKFFDIDFRNYSRPEEIRQDNLQDLFYVTWIRALVAQGFHSEAVRAAAEAFEQPLTRETRIFLSDTISLVFRREVLAVLESEGVFPALAFYDEFYTSIPRSKAEFFLEYLLQLSQGAANLGLGDYAERLVRRFREYAGETTYSRYLASDTKSFDLDSHLMRSNIDFTLAKALFVGGSEDYEEIGALLDSVVDESPLSFEKQILRAKLAEKSKDYSSAMLHLSNALLLVPAGSEKTIRRLRFWMAEFYSKGGHYSESVEILGNVERGLANSKVQDDSQALSVLGVPNEPGILDVLIAKSDQYEKLGNWKKAATTYKNALTHDNNSNRLKYALARALDKEGSSKAQIDAKEIFQELSQKENQDFWTKLAQEALLNREVSNR